MINSDSVFAHKLRLAQQKGEEAKLNPLLVKETIRIRKQFEIPEYGFENNVQSINWQRTTLRLRLLEWSNEITKLRLSLNKAIGWQDSLERYMRSNRLIAPIYSVRYRYTVDLECGIVSKQLVILDEPINKRDLDEIIKRNQAFENISVKRTRLYPMDIYKRVHELSSLKIKFSDTVIAKYISQKFNTVCSYKDISDIRRYLEKKIKSDE